MHDTAGHFRRVDESSSCNNTPINRSFVRSFILLISLDVQDVIAINDPRRLLFSSPFIVRYGAPATYRLSLSLPLQTSALMSIIVKCLHYAEATLRVARADVNARRFLLCSQLSY